MKLITSFTLAGLLLLSAPLSAKPPIKGFVSRGDLDSTVDGWTSNRNGFDDPFTLIDDQGTPGDTSDDLLLGHLVDAIMVQAEWRTLEPTEGNLATNNVVDQAIRKVSDWNTAHPNNPLSIKLRVFAGMYSPKWLALNNNGNPIMCSTAHLTNENLCFVNISTKNGKNGYIPSYWKSAYATKWQNFHSLMAGRYDSRGLIREVSLGGCAVANDESFWRHKGDDTPNGNDGVHVIRHLMNKGLTLEKDKNCLKNTQFSAMSAWSKTNIGVAYNVWFDYEANGNDLIWTQNLSFTRTAMQKCVDKFGSRCNIANNSYGNRDIGDEDDSNKISFWLKLAGTEATWHNLASKFSFIRDAQNTYIQTEVWAAKKDENNQFIGGEANEIHTAILVAHDKMKIHSAEIPKLRDLKRYDTYLNDIYLSSTRVQNVRAALKE
ncbi:hypothetical protein [Shewanella sp. GXUN23E]|uniref:hypothetical protein n=1 Tax=Shewanella sp. GXUN23E TaxID=3422498 RepID=UPI003D7C4F11